MLTEIPSDYLASDDREEFLRGATKYYRAWTIRLLWISLTNALLACWNAWMFASSFYHHGWPLGIFSALASGIGVYALARTIPGLISSFRGWQAHVFLLEITISRKRPDPS